MSGALFQDLTLGPTPTFHISAGGPGLWKILAEPWSPSGLDVSGRPGHAVAHARQHRARQLGRWADGPCGRPWGSFKVRSLIPANVVFFSLIQGSYHETFKFENFCH